MKIQLLLASILSFVAIPDITNAQYIEKVNFDSSDSTDGYYLAIRPRSGEIKGTLILLSTFYDLNGVISETKLHNVGYAYGNDMLTVFLSLKQKLYADSAALSRINAAVKNVVQKYSPDTSRFAIGGFDFAGIIALRYTELTYQYPANFLVHPKAVFTVDSPVDLFGLWHWCEREIKKNYSPGVVGDAKYLIDLMTKENGSIYKNHEAYSVLTAFEKEKETPGNEQYLKNVAVRTYFDTDIEWQLKNKRNSFYDTNIPDGSEFINRLLLLGNANAEFVSSRQPGVRSNGERNPTSLSIVDEAECIKWLKEKFDIFDPNTWHPPYTLDVPNGWSIERFSLPPDFASEINYKGVEDLRFTPGWGDTLSEEHWSYSFIWWLDGDVKMSADGLQETLKEYYTGLIRRNIISRKIPAIKVVPTLAMIKKIKTEPNDIETYGGTISMLDYHTQSPIKLNCFIHVKDIKSKYHTAIYFEVSPKPLSHSVWQKLNEIGNSFKPEE